MLLVPNFLTHIFFNVSQMSTVSICLKLGFLGGGSCTGSLWKEPSRATAESEVGVERSSWSAKPSQWRPLWIPLGVLELIPSLVSPKGKRLGSYTSSLTHLGCSLPPEEGPWPWVSEHSSAKGNIGRDS